MAFRDDDATGQFRYLEGYVELRRAKVSTFNELVAITESKLG